MTTQPVTAAFNPNEARDPTGKWTAGGGGSAQARALEAQRKTTTPKAAAPGKVLVHKPYHSPGGGGGGGAGGGGGSAAGKKAAAAKKAAVKKAAASKKTAARAAAAQQTKALRARVAQTEAGWRAAEKAKHQQFMDAYKQAALEEQQRLAMWQQSIANMPAGMAAGARKAAAARHAEWLAAHHAAYSGEQRRHIAATAKITKAVAALNAQRNAQITLTKANRDQTIARLNAQATAAVNAIKASVALTADATAHTRTPDALARYWLHGPGAAKIRWGEGNDWYRCVAQLSQYVHNPHAVKGQCNSLHKLATGLWPATHDKILHGGGGGGGKADAAVAAAITAGHPYPGQHYKHGWIPVDGTALHVEGKEASDAALPAARKAMQGFHAEHLHNYNVRDWREAHLDPHWQYSREQAAAISHYTEAGFRDMNRALRDGKTDTPGVAEIDSAMKGLPEDLILHRSVPLGRLRGLVDAKPGTIFSDPAYSSTTLVPGRWGANLPDNVKLMIRAPKGTPAVWARPVSEYSTEDEVVLDRGQRFAILKVTPAANTRDSYTIEVLALPPAEPGGGRAAA